MTDRDRLIKLLQEPPADWEGNRGVGAIADHLLANGVIVPPCKVGDKVYQADGVRIYESTIYEMTYTTNKIIYCTENICFDETAVGKTVFLIKEEAEEKLKELENGTL